MVVGRRTLVSALAVATLVVPLAGCGGGDDGAGPADPPAAASDPEGFTALAARRCSDLANELDPAVTAAARQHTMDLIEAKLRRTQLEPDSLDAAATALDDRLDQLRHLRSELAALDAPADVREDWERVVAAVDPEIDVLESRLDLLRTGDPSAVLAGIEPGAVDAPGDDVGAALELLGLAGRDCEVLYGFAGNDPAHEEFLRHASSACTTTASRRHAGGFDEARRVVLAAVAGAVRDGEVEPTDDLRDALEQLVAEWRQTLADHEAVATTDVPDPGEWDAVLEHLRGQVALHEARLDALDDGDPRARAAAFRPASTQDDSAPGDLEALGLDQRDCRSAVL